MLSTLFHIHELIEAHDWLLLLWLTVFYIPPNFASIKGLSWIWTRNLLTTMWLVYALISCWFTKPKQQAPIPIKSARCEIKTLSEASQSCPTFIFPLIQLALMQGELYCVLAWPLYLKKQKIDDRTFMKRFFQHYNRI